MGCSFPGTHTTLGLFGFSVAPPEVVGELAAAFEKVQAGQVQYKSAGEGKVIYEVGSITFLMRLPTSAR